MKEITVSCYVLKNYNEKQSEALVERLKAFCARMNPRLEKMETKLRLREIVFDEINEDALMSAGMITFKTEDGQETPAEQLLDMELDFELAEGQEFPSRIYRGKNGEKYSEINDSLLTAALLRTAFGLSGACEGDCEHCSAECGL